MSTAGSVGARIPRGRTGAGWAAAACGAGVVGILTAKAGPAMGLLLAAAAPVVFVVFLVLRTPRLGLYLALPAAFVGAGLGRYVPAPTGLLVDATLALAAAAVVLQPKRASLAALKSPLVAMTALWMAYNVLELFNPEARSAVAWFYAGRGVFLYMTLAVPLGLVLLRRKPDLDRVILIWMGFSVLGAAWGIKQKFMGLDGAEAAWLSVPGNQTTHLLFGKLRVFSFFSDAGQFGAAQGHAAVVALILALGGSGRLKKLAFLGVAALCGYGLLISGTRGAMAVPAVGILVYLILSRNWKILLVGVLCLSAAYGALRFTYVGHGIYEVRRMRTAVVQGTDNPSLQIRLENQRRLAGYLEGRPFGGGVGSAGYWGTRFSPGTFLADLPLDSWYVRIWAEQGRVGLVLYVTLLAYVLVGGLCRLRRIRDPDTRHRLLALYAGLAGIVAASYGNQVLGQMPTGILVYLTLAFLFLQQDQIEIARLDQAVAESSASLRFQPVSSSGAMEP